MQVNSSSNQFIVPGTRSPCGDGSGSRGARHPGPSFYYIFLGVERQAVSSGSRVGGSVSLYTITNLRVLPTGAMVHTISSVHPASAAAVGAAATVRGWRRSRQRRRVVERRRLRRQLQLGLRVCPRQREQLRHVLGHRGDDDPGVGPRAHATAAAGMSWMPRMPSNDNGTNPNENQNPVPGGARTRAGLRPARPGLEVLREPAGQESGPDGRADGRPVGRRSGPSLILARPAVDRVAASAVATARHLRREDGPTSRGPPALAGDRVDGRVGRSVTGRDRPRSGFGVEGDRPDDVVEVVGDDDRAVGEPGAADARGCPAPSRSSPGRCRDRRPSRSGP